MRNFSIFPQIIFDTSSKEYFSSINKNRIFIVADPMMIKLGFVEQLTKIFAVKQLDVDCFSEITPDPTVEVIAKGLEKMNSFQPDCLIAIGGGSAIDTAKGMILSNYMLNTDYQRPEFIAVPSTSGTGSEVTSFTVVTNQEDKKPFVDQRLLPDVAVLDVDLVKTVPPNISADTGMDVLTHAIEAYVSTDASEFSDALAEKAVQLVFENLPNIYKNPTDLEARNLMHKASSLAGMAFTNASLGINHSLAHAIGAAFHLPHGRINAILLPSVIEYNSQTKAIQRYQQLAKSLGLPASNAEEGKNNLILAITILNQELEIPQRFADFDLTEEEFAVQNGRIVKAALKDDCTKTNPRQPDEESLSKLYETLY